MKSSKKQINILQAIIYALRNISFLFVRRYDVLPFQTARTVEKFDVVTAITRRS